MNLEEFRDELIEDIRFQVSTDGLSDKEALMEYYKGVLIDAEEIDDINYISFEGIGKRRGKIEIDGYMYDELDDILSLFICTPLSFSEINTLTKTEARKYFDRAKNFIVEKDFILENAEESSPGYGLAYDLKHKYQNVRKYKIYLLTDMMMSDRIKDLEADVIDNKTIEYNIWDISRIFQVEISKTGKC